MTIFYFFTRFSVFYNTFRPSWPSSGNAHYVWNTWEEISNVKFYVKKRELSLYKLIITIIIIYIIMLQK